MVGCISICTHFNSGLSCNSLNDLVLDSTDSEWMSGIFCSSWAVVSRPSSFKKSTRRLSAFTMLIFPVKEIIRHVFNRAGARERLPKFPKHETGIWRALPRTRSAEYASHVPVYMYNFYISTSVTYYCYCSDVYTIRSCNQLALNWTLYH